MLSTQTLIQVFLLTFMLIFIQNTLSAGGPHLCNLSFGVYMGKRDYGLCRVQGDDHAYVCVRKFCSNQQKRIGDNPVAAASGCRTSPKTSPFARVCEFYELDGSGTIIQCDYNSLITKCELLTDYLNCKACTPL